jgi:hypothetical protein
MKERDVTSPEAVKGKINRFVPLRSIFGLQKSSKCAFNSLFSWRPVEAVNGWHYHFIFKIITL